MSTKLVSTGVTFPDGSTQTTALDASGVAAGSYGSATAIPTLTINANGIITAASTASVSVPANCTNCSSYTNLTDKPTIPSNCTNCSGDINSGGSYSFTQCDNPQNCGDNQCQNCWFQCYDTGATVKSGTALLQGYRKVQQKQFNCNC